MLLTADTSLSFQALNRDINSAHGSEITRETGLGAVLNGPPHHLPVASPRNGGRARQGCDPLTRGSDGVFRVGRGVRRGHTAQREP